MREAVRDLSCPNGCVEFEVSIRLEVGDPEVELDELVKDDATCPECGAPLGGDDE